MKIFIFTVTRATTPQRLELLASTILNAYRTADLPFTWHIWAVDGCVVPGIAATRVDKIHSYEDNIGQHVAWNEAYAIAKKEKYDYFLRLDDDCEFRTQRWLKKLVDTSVAVDDKMILSPRIRGLKYPPESSSVVLVKGLPLTFLFDAIGGICRLHPMPLIKDYVADARRALGAGDATGIATYCRQKLIPMAYCQHIRVKHAKTTEGQEASDLEHFRLHPIFQHIPYIPAYRVENV